MTATASSLTRDRAGRFTPRRVAPCCATCHWTLAEDLAGRLYCPSPRCETYRVAVDVVADVNLGVLTAADLDAGVRGE